MRTTSYRSSSYRSQATLRGRATSWLLALALGVLIVIALVRLGGMTQRVERQDRPLSTFDIAPETRTAATRRPSPSAARAQPRKVTPPPAAPPPVPPPPPVPTRGVPGMIVLSSEEFAAADIGKMRRGEQSASGDGRSGDSSASVQGPGEGPGGERIYDAEWYRRPSRAELATYLPGAPVGSWGVIACRMIEGYHVENCRELAESPGSGMARGMRRASWQFLVRPPRVGGRAMLGTMVRIRIDITADGDPG
jgi:protein TonB